MSSLMLVLAITCGFLLVTCLYLAASTLHYKGMLRIANSESKNNYDKLVQEKRAHSLLKNSLKKTK